ncbi:hypothetical protein ACJRO7_021123 [Eucalyptus globulus]|uniref:Uncharacterized protein n=1 Tax=Eucalyptus globulus TaxID=34317 RepID=A0ABD3KIS7_EUCGL
MRTSSERIGGERWRREEQRQARSRPASRAQVLGSDGRAANGTATRGIWSRCCGGLGSAAERLHGRLGHKSAGGVASRADRGQATQGGAQRRGRVGRSATKTVSGGNEQQDLGSARHREALGGNGSPKSWVGAARTGELGRKTAGLRARWPRLASASRRRRCGNTAASGGQRRSPIGMLAERRWVRGSSRMEVAEAAAR